MERLDALQVALWDKAIAGELDACREVRAIIEARCRLLGLKEQSKRAARTPRTVVLSAEDRRVLGL